jgi:hypothetical protein
VAGQRFRQTFPALPNQRTTFTWDGKDAYGRAVQGSVPFTVRIGYTYGGTYMSTLRFGYNGDGTPISGNRAALQVTLSQVQPGYLTSWDALAQGLGGWNLTIHHGYDPGSHRLYLGEPWT